MAVYNAYRVDEITGHRDVASQATVIADTSWQARQFYASAHGLDVLAVLAIREDLDHRDGNGDPKQPHIVIENGNGTYLWAIHSTRGLLDRAPFTGLAQRDVLRQRLREAFPGVEIIDKTT